MEWAPKTRYQAARNRTCGPTCAARAVSAAKVGRATGRKVQWITLNCVECGTTFERTPSWAKRGSKEPTCSRRCNGLRRGREWAQQGHKGSKARTPESYASASRKMTGPLNPAWKGGVMVMRSHGTHRGARYVRCPEGAMPMARKDGYVMEHRIVMATMARRLLTRTEVVHHLDHDPLNNVVMNLELWPTNRDHKLEEHGRFVEGVGCLMFLEDLGAR